MLFSARRSREEQENPRKVQLFSNLLIRLSRNCATQILNFISCSDWFRREIISTEPIRAADEIPPTKVNNIFEVGKVYFERKTFSFST